MKKEKHIPLRQCMGCREHKPKAELLRITRTAEGMMTLDIRGKIPGRGVYLCRSQACLRRVGKNRSLERHLHGAVPPEVMQALQELIGGAGAPSGVSGGQTGEPGAPEGRIREPGVSEGRTGEPGAPEVF